MARLTRPRILEYETIVIAARTPITTMTTSNSTIVKAGLESFKLRQVFLELDIAIFILIMAMMILKPPPPKTQAVYYNLTSG